MGGELQLIFTPVICGLCNNHYEIIRLFDDKDNGNVIDGIIDDNYNHVLYSGYYMNKSAYVFMIIIV